MGEGGWEREESAASQRITFQEEFAAETQEGRRSMIRREFEYVYNGGVSASSGASEDQRARETKGGGGEGGTCARQGPGYRNPRWNGARARDHESIAALSDNCAMACQKGCLMATMQIPIPALMPAISRRAIEEEARHVSDTFFWTYDFLGGFPSTPNLRYRPVNRFQRNATFFYSVTPCIPESFVRGVLCGSRHVFAATLNHPGRLA